jgi:hypothetical protein
MNTDKYDEVINGEETYQKIAETLYLSSAVIIGWTDEEMTHYDILFTQLPFQFGSNLQGGIKPTSDLFVSIMRKGAFAFDIKNTDTHWSYYSEKLGGGFGETTGQKLADLINGVKKYL